MEEVRLSENDRDISETGAVTEQEQEWDQTELLEQNQDEPDVVPGDVADSDSQC